MANYNLSFYYNTPFTPATQVGWVDTFTGNGIQTTFPVINEPIANIGASIMVGNTIYWQYNGGFTVGASSITLPTAPPINAQGVIPSAQPIIIAAFDQANVTGVASPQVQQVPFWLIDPTTINTYGYQALPTFPGIALTITNLISGAGAQTSWIQLACADASGNALTFQATGTNLYTASINSIGTLTASAAPLASSLFVTNASSYIAGDYIKLNVGNGNQETVHVIATNPASGMLTIDATGLIYSHGVGEVVYTIGRKFWMQLSVPLNANNNTPINLYNLGLQPLVAVTARP